MVDKKGETIRIAALFSHAKMSLQKNREGTIGFKAPFHPLHFKIPALSMGYDKAPDARELLYQFYEGLKKK